MKNCAGFRKVRLRLKSWSEISRIKVTKTAIFMATKPSTATAIPKRIKSVKCATNKITIAILVSKSKTATLFKVSGFLL
ncbi:YcxB family protein [Psychrobacter aquimaris]|uniref:YcxB family protein n=1 Tax=Psychrobacter aquimaris TaxID=292733 RepID=UPI003FD0FE07